MDQAGNYVPYSDGRAGLSEVIFTNRHQFIASGTRKIGQGSLRLAMGYAKHKQDSFYEKILYKANQTQYYLEASAQHPVGETLLGAGLTYRYEDLDSSGAANGVSMDGTDSYKYRTPAVLLQAYRAFFDDSVEVNGSVRYDRHNVFGGITSPRLNVLVNHSHEWNSRVALGKGFRAPTSFFEQDHGILSTTRVIRQVNAAETSNNLSYALSYAGDRLASVISLNYNKVNDMAMLDASQCEQAGVVQPCTGATSENKVTLMNTTLHPVTIKGADATLTYKLTPQWETTVAAEYFRYRFDPGTLAFARPQTRAYWRMDYEGGPWTGMLRGTWTGAMDLARFYDYANTPRYNFDGTPKMNKSPTFWVFDMRGEYQVNKQWAVYLGVDNITDFQQTDKESMLWVDAAGVIDYTHLWGPNRGRFVYAGVKYAL